MRADQSGDDFVPPQPSPGNATRRGQVKRATARDSRAPATVSGNGSADKISAIAGLGDRLRAERTRADISLRQLARSLNVSASFLSQIELGKSQPSVATLYQICQVLGLHVGDLFQEAQAGTAEPGARVASSRRQAAPAVSVDAPHRHPDRPSPVVSPDERLRLVLDSGVVWEKLSPVTGEPSVDFMFVQYHPGGSSTAHGQVTRHMGVEYGYVLSGMLEVTLGFETYHVGPQQAITFDSSIPHRLANNGTEPVEAVWFVHGRDAAHQH